MHKLLRIYCQPHGLRTCYTENHKTEIKQNTCTECILSSSLFPKCTSRFSTSLFVALQSSRFTFSVLELAVFGILYFNTHDHHFRWIWTLILLLLLPEQIVTLIFSVSWFDCWLLTIRCIFSVTFFTSLSLFICWLYKNYGLFYLRLCKELITVESLSSFFNTRLRRLLQSLCSFRCQLTLSKNQLHLLFSLKN